MKVEQFEDLDIWKLSRELCKIVKQITSKAPFCNDYKLRDQIRGSSGSTMDNIAEGFERGGNKEFIQFLWISKGSCGECRSQSYRAYDNEYIDKNELDDLIQKTSTLSRKIFNFISYLNESDLKGAKFH